MSIRQFRPMTAATRFKSVSGFDEITRATPEKSLLEPMKKSGGRNNQGHLTSRHRGGGHKRQYRKIDFKRNKFGIPGKVSRDRVRSEPERPHRAHRVCRRREAVHPASQGAAPGRRGRSRGRARTAGPGNALPLSEVPLGTTVHNIELKIGKGGQLARTAGSSAQVVAKEGEYVTLRLRSTEMRLVHGRCLATIGEVGNAEHELLSVGKAGKSRWLGKRPKVRGVAMNPVDHPLGGGEGKSSGGRPPTSPWGKVEGRKTRHRKKPSTKLIVRGRKRGKATQ